MNDAVLPAIKARKATCARSLCRSGAMVASAAIWVPIDPGLANPHNAKVAIVSDRFYWPIKTREKVKNHQSIKYLNIVLVLYRNNALCNVFRKFAVSGKLVDYCLQGHQIGNEVTFRWLNSHQESYWDEYFPHNPLRKWKK